MSNEVADNVKAAPLEKRLKLQQDVRAKDVSPGQLVLIDRVNGVIAVQKVKDPAS